MSLRNVALKILGKHKLFRDLELPFLLSPEPLALPAPILRELQRLGPVLQQFQRCCQQLYKQSAKKHTAPWLAPLLDAGKPCWMVDAQRHTKQPHALPRIIRPDLLWCDAGLRLTEIDSVPGGLGILHFLHQLYSQAGYDNELLGGTQAVLDGFCHAYPEGALICVSDESADYRAEMHYLLSELPHERFSYLRAEDLTGQSHPCCLYRFFELFDHENIPAARDLIRSWAQGELTIDPPPLAHLEEKAWLALFHLPALQSWWQTHLRATQRETLQRIIPRSWLLDPSPIPPHASLPWLGINDWRDLGKLSQRERHLVLKISGFNERAWGARGVHIGHDLSAAQWNQALHEAHSHFPDELWIMQEYCNTTLIKHPYYDDQDQLHTMTGRVRLCPYYATDAQGENTRLISCLATLVPQNKKKIHGMKNSILVPCILT